MFERYTEKARRVIFFARYEASLVQILRDCGLIEAGIRAHLLPSPPSSDPEQGRNYV